MPKSKKRKPKRTAHPSPRRRHDGPPGHDDDPDLLVEVRAVLCDDHPLGLLALASTILAAADSRSDPPMVRAGLAAGPQRPALADLVESFVAIPRAETTGLLAAFAEMLPDELQRRRVAREVARRDDRVPSWLRPLGPLVVERTLEMGHVLRDGDNVLLGARTASGHPLTAVVYIDHNLGTVAKDAFVLDEPVDATLRSFRESAGDDPDMFVRALDPADARARVTEAIELGVITYPPFESESWPAARPLVEALVRQLPEGGTGYVRPQWSDEDRSGLADRFFASPYARHHDAEDRELFESILWFACDYGPGDPLRWSPTAVELLLADWLPRKVVADAPFLARAPDLLRSYIQWCHAERGIRPSLTDETLEAVDLYEPQYQQTIRSARPQGVHALMEAMRHVPAFGDDAGRWGEAIEPPTLADPAQPARFFESSRLPPGRNLGPAAQDLVGGEDALAALDDRPLPDEDLDLAGVPEDVEDVVLGVAALVDDCCDALLDTECRTACRRLLADAARQAPEAFRGRAKAETTAHAVVWLVAKANGILDGRPPRVPASALQAHFRGRSQPYDRAKRLQRALGLPEWNAYGGGLPVLGSPRYLTGERRRSLLRERDLASPG